MKNSTTYGFFIGRLNPIHLGHERIIEHMIQQCGPDNSTLVLGSCNAPRSMRHFFSYADRRKFVRMLYPEIRIVGLPDYGSDEDWLRGLDDLIEAIGGDVATARFFGGSEEDVRFFADAGRPFELLNRYDGTTPKISASEVRDSLLHKRPLDGLLNPKIQKPAEELFWQHWEEFRNQ